MTIIFDATPYVVIEKTDLKKKSMRWQVTKISYKDDSKNLHGNFATQYESH